MVCFLILHYMVTEVTCKCVDSIINNVKGDKHILIVDNCSPNNSYGELKKKYEQFTNVTVVKNIANNGFAKGNNYGYEYAKKNIRPDFICCMNNDMEIEQEDFVEKIVDLYHRNKYYVLGPDVLSVSAKIHQNPEHKTVESYDELVKQYNHFSKSKDQRLKYYIKGFLKSIGIINKFYYGIKDKVKEEKNDWKTEKVGTALHGSCLIFSPDYISVREYAFFPETTFYCEAQILDYECRRDGMKMMYSPELRLLHYEDLATNAVFKKYAEKAIFVNKCMFESLTAFKKLMENDMKKGR